jgi:hypothetical protein
MSLNTPDPGHFLAAFVQKHNPSKRSIELYGLWDSAFNWLCKHVDHSHLDPLHPLLRAAMALYMLHILENDPKRSQAHLFSAHELLAIFP